MPKPRTTSLAKLTRPRLRGAVSRERLFAMLDRARDEHPACCVVAPPGAGKTTLVASWLDARAIKGLWYQVDAGDTDLATFFYYLGLAALPFARKRQQPLPLLTPEYLADVDGFSRRFFRELFARLPAGATLVLDNYQELHAAHRFHDLIAKAVEEVPPGITLIAVSRRDPPECYARLIANQNVAFLDWADLKLTLNEALVIGARRGGGNAQQVRRAFEVTEGWAAGLVLMLERREGADDDLQSGAGHQMIFDYFAAQIFAHISAEARHFLMTVAWLPSVSVPVATRLTGYKQARALLEDLYTRHLFVHRREGGLPSYHFHALFKAFLCDRASAHFSERRLQSIKTKAAALLHEHGDGEAAIELYFSIGSWQQAIPVILQLAPVALSRGRWRVAQVMCLSAIMETHWLQWIDFTALDALIERTIALLETKPTFAQPGMDLRVHTILLVALSHRRPGSPYMSHAQQRVMTLMGQPLDDVERLLAATILVGHALPPFDLALAR